MHINLLRCDRNGIQRNIPLLLILFILECRLYYDFDLRGPQSVIYIYIYLSSTVACPYERPARLIPPSDLEERGYRNIHEDQDYQN